MADNPSPYIPVLKPGVDIAYPGDPQPQIDAATQKLYADSLPKTVQIKTDRGAGSGFFMDPDGSVGTAAHVVLGSREQFAITSDGTKYKLQIEKLDDINDIAILRPIGMTPNSRPFAELGLSKNLKPDQEIFPMGHPGGLRPAYISPGKFTGDQSQQQVFTTLDPAGDKAITEGLKHLPDIEVESVKAALARQSVGGAVHIRPGDSGGPGYDAEGKIIGVNDFITKLGKDGFLVPSEKMIELYNNKNSDFKFTYNRVADPWAQDYKNMWTEKPVVAVAETAGVMGLGQGGYMLMSRFPRAFGAAATLAEGYSLLHSTENLLSSTDPQDKLKFSLATAADLTGVVSSLALFSARFRMGGAVGLAIGIAGRAAVDFLPTHLVLTDIERKSNPLLPPMNQDVQKTLGF